MLGKNDTEKSFKIIFFHILWFVFFAGKELKIATPQKGGKNMVKCGFLYISKLSVI